MVSPSQSVAYSASSCLSINNINGPTNHAKVTLCHIQNIWFPIKFYCYICVSQENTWNSYKHRCHDSTYPYTHALDSWDSNLLNISWSIYCFDFYIVAAFNVRKFQFQQIMSDIYCSLHTDNVHNTTCFKVK